MPKHTATEKFKDPRPLTERALPDPAQTNRNGKPCRIASGLAAHLWPFD
jgi:hypothetical protein